MERVEALATKYKLAIDGIPIQGMKDDLALSAMLRAPRASLRAGQHLVGDTLGQAESEAWEAFLAYYGALSGIAKHQAALAAELAPIVDFMSTRPRAGGRGPARRRQGEGAASRRPRPSVTAAHTSRPTIVRRSRPSATRTRTTTAGTSSAATMGRRCRRTRARMARGRPWPERTLGQRTRPAGPCCAWFL
jgi:hypothetical protein